MKKNTDSRCCNIKPGRIVDFIAEACFAVFFVAASAACSNKIQEHVPVMNYVYTYYENGAVEEIGMLQDSMKQGLWIAFYPDGKIKYTSFYKHNKRNGAQMYFYEDGTLASYHEMLDDMFHGKHMSYYRNGQMANQYFTLRDTTEELIIHYEYDGKLEYIHEYRKGKYVRTIAGMEPFAIETE